MTAAIVALLVVLAGCGSGGSSAGGDGGGSGSSACSEVARKQWVVDVARRWYLFDELLPSNVDLAGFDTAEALLDHLTAIAREQRKDRYFSYLTTRTEEDALLGDGQYVGFGVRTRTDEVDRPMIVEVFEASPAADGGLLRGDEIVSVDSGSGYVPVADLLADGSTISDVLGPAEAGVRRGLRLLRGGVTHEVVLVKRTVTIDPVPDGYGEAVLPLAGTAGVGYLNLRTYASSADAQLRDAFARFRELGLTDYIVDLRYNGGGLLATAELLDNLLGGTRMAGDVQMRLLHNEARTGENETRYFHSVAQSVPAVRVAFLTTSVTASASEINANTLAPWLEVAIVGEDTLGKPVGQYAFDLQGCDDRLRLVSFRTVNALDEGDYYDGLAGTLRFACAARDDPDQPIGSPGDALVQGALEWLGSGACASLIAGDAAREKPVAGDRPGRSRQPARRPSPLQHWLPGVD
jgi:C-terminal processing protease CtpA/Prc